MANDGARGRTPSTTGNHCHYSGIGGNRHPLEAGTYCRYLSATAICNGPPDQTFLNHYNITANSERIRIFDGHFTHQNMKEMKWYTTIENVKTNPKAERIFCRRVYVSTT